MQCMIYIFARKTKPTRICAIFMLISFITFATLNGISLDRSETVRFFFSLIKIYQNVYVCIYKYVIIEN